MDSRQTAGVILAGGRSSRMGRDKALLEYRGRPLLAHTVGLLNEAGLTDIFISGSPREVMPDCHYIEDETPFYGPAAAIVNIIKQLPSFKKFLFVPVDMPLLTSDDLRRLMAQDRGGWFQGWPLPVSIPATAAGPVDNAYSVRGLLEAWGIPALALEGGDYDRLVNVNTPEQWQVISA